MTSRLGRHIATLTLALLCTVAVVASSEPASAATQRALLRQRVTAYSNAFLDGRGADAYRMLTARCKLVIDRSQFLAASTLAKSLYGGPLPFTSYRATIDGRRARVTYTYSVSALNQSREPWKRVDGLWRNNDC